MLERERWPLWLPVFLGLGIAVYFALPVEPVSWLGAAFLAATVAAALLARRWNGAFLVWVPLTFVALGFAAAQFRSTWVAAPVLERPSGKVSIQGLVDEVEPLAEGGQRVTLVRPRVALDGPVPTKLRLRLKQDLPLPVGAEIRLDAMLVPPPQPMAPGAFDFARHAWFMGLGAVGTGLSTPVIVTPPPDSPGLGRLRQHVLERVTGQLPGATGGVAAALVTGETSAIPRPVLDAYRDSGLAHLLSISGLHMSLLAGMAFFMLRGGLALVPAVALRHPIKKWAAGLALVATFFYMLLAGAPVPAQRAFLMTGIVLLAVMLDRSALSMRLVAWAAILVLLAAPDALIGPSFQMSFAAVLALIASYEKLSSPMAAWRAAHQEWHHRLALYMVGLVLSSLVAGSATALYGAYHFNRFALWSVLANMAAVPLTGVLVMPSAMLSLLLMPFGLEGLALVPMGWGVAAINWVAAQVASLPGASLLLPPLPLWGLVLFTLGGLWLALWQGTWRLWGLAGMAAGLAGFLTVTPPDVLVDGRGYAFAVRMKDGSLLVNRGGRLLRDTWERRAGPLSAEAWPKAATSADQRLACAPGFCLWRDDGRRVAYVQKDEVLADACASADWVIAAVPVRDKCRGRARVVDRFDLWRQGAHALWLSSGRVESVAAWQGDRPWSHHPAKRRKKHEEISPNISNETNNGDS
ncbi:MAG: ComEC family competence protein [Magnetospirillum sp.]|nr:ComEC family competence protein [Magnetospirillum sp.]